MNENVPNINQELKLTDRKILSFNGVKKLVKFDYTEFLVDSNLGLLDINGEKMELLALDIQGGNIKIKGHIKEIKYVDRVNNSKKESLLSKLFK